MPELPSNEFARPLSLAQVGERELRQTVTAEPAELRALAKRLGLLELRRLEGDLALRRLRGGRVLRVAGRLAAEVVQACVVTLEPVPATIEGEVAEDLALVPPEAGEGGELVIDPTAEDEPEPPGPELLDDAGVLDLGELLVQLLAERLDPYPRSPGATLEDLPEDAEADLPEGRTRPFADLEKKLRRH